MIKKAGILNKIVYKSHFIVIIIISKMFSNFEANFEEDKEMPRDNRLMAIGYLMANFNFTACAKQFGVSDRTISRLFERFNKTGSVDDMERTGRPIQITEEIKEKVISEIKIPYESTRSVGAKFNLSRTTISSIAHDNGLHFATPEEIPLINEAHKEKRYEFCKLFYDDPLDYWVFSDECGFQLFRNTMGMWTDQNKIYVQKTNPYRCLMIWGAISKFGKSPIYFIDSGETEDQNLYIKILETTLIPWAASSFPDNFYIFYQDNAPCHRAKNVLDWMNSHIPHIADVPPNSPDFNPIEHIWAIVKNEVEKKQPHSKHDLEEAINLAWMNIDQDTINNCIDHCHRRIMEVRENKGEFI